MPVAHAHSLPVRLSRPEDHPMSPRHTAIGNCTRSCSPACRGSWLALAAFKVVAVFALLLAAAPGPALADPIGPGFDLTGRADGVRAVCEPSQKGSGPGAACQDTRPATMSVDLSESGAGPASGPVRLRGVPPMGVGPSDPLPVTGMLLAQASTARAGEPPAIARMGSEAMCLLDSDGGIGYSTLSVNAAPGVPLTLGPAAGADAPERGHPVLAKSAIGSPSALLCPSDCSDADPCTVDRCDPDTGQCVHAPPNCDDGDACTLDRCVVQKACVVPDNGGGTADLPPQGCGYVSPDRLHEIINGLPAGTTIQVSAVHSGFFNMRRFPGGSLDGEVETFDSSLALKMDGTGMLAGYN